MAKDIDIRNGDVVLLEAMGILHECVQNLLKLQYSFCFSPSGCLPSREAVNSQGVAVGENMFQHFVLPSIAELFRGGESLQGSGRYFLLQYSFCCSPSGCLPSRVAVNSQGAAIGENLLRHSVLPSVAELFRGGESLQGSGRYSLLQCSFCCSPSGCLPSRVAVNSQGAAIGENLLRHSVPLGSAIQSLQGSNRYSLRQSRRIAPADAPSMSLQGSNRYSLRHGRRVLLANTPSMSLQGSDGYFLRHRRRIAPANAPSMSLKGSDRYSPAA